MRSMFGILMAMMMMGQAWGIGLKDIALAYGGAAVGSYVSTFVATVKEYTEITIKPLATYTNIPSGLYPGEEMTITQAALYLLEDIIREPDKIYEFTTNRIKEVLYENIPASIETQIIYNKYCHMRKRLQAFISILDQIMTVNLKPSFGEKIRGTKNSLHLKILARVLEESIFQIYLFWFFAETEIAGRIACSCLFSDTPEHDLMEGRINGSTYDFKHKVNTKQSNLDLSTSGIIGKALYECFTGGLVAPEKDFLAQIHSAGIKLQREHWTFG